MNETMKTIEIPTTILLDPTISYESKGLYCYLYARHRNYEPILPDNFYQERKWKKSIRELVTNGYIDINENNIFFKK